MNASKAEPRIVVVSLLAVLLGFGLLAGCAKRPAVSQAAAPPPTGETRVAPPPPAVTPAPAAPSTPAAPPPAPAPAPAPPAPAAPPPVAPPPPPAEFAPRAALAALHCDFDTSDIRPQDARILDENAAWLKANPQHLVLIEGHCDERGTNEYNLALGERRAQAARSYLVAHGVAANRMLVISYGEERPECIERNEACWARNRQARFLTKPQ